MGVAAKGAWFSGGYANTGEVELTSLLPKPAAGRPSLSCDLVPPETPGLVLTGTGINTIRSNTASETARQCASCASLHTHRVHEQRWSTCYIQMASHRSGVAPEWAEPVLHDRTSGMCMHFFSLSLHFTSSTMAG